MKRKKSDPIKPIFVKSETQESGGFLVETSALYQAVQPTLKKDFLEVNGRVFPAAPFLEFLAIIRDYDPVTVNFPDDVHALEVCTETSRSVFYTDDPEHPSRFFEYHHYPPPDTIPLHFVDELPAQERTELDPWIAKAISKDRYRDELRLHYGNVASDGFRLHYDSALPHITHPDVTEPNWSTIIVEAGQSGTTLQHINAKNAAKAIKSAKKFNRDRITLVVAGNGLVVSVTNEDLDHPIEFIAGTGNQSMADALYSADFKPNLLIDALSGFTDKVDLNIRDRGDGAMLHFQAGTREAVIMSLLKGKDDEDEDE